MQRVLWITCFLSLGGGWCRGGESLGEQGSNLLYNLLILWRWRLTNREGPGELCTVPAAGSRGLPCLWLPEIPRGGRNVPGSWSRGVGLPAPTLFPKSVVPWDSCDSLGIWVGREELIDGNYIDIAVIFSFTVTLGGSWSLADTTAHYLGDQNVMSYLFPRAQQTCALF